MRALNILLALLLLTGVASAWAEVPQMPRFRIVDSADGLPSSAIAGVAQDRAGYLWLATGDGLARYDGAEFKVWRHDPRDPASLAGNSVQAIYIDRQDRIWVGSEAAGISVLDAERKRFRHYRKAQAPEMSNDNVFVIEGRGDEVWFGNYGGDVHRIDAQGRITRFDLAAMDDGLPRSHVVALALGAEGRMWIGTPEGLAYFDGQALHRERLPDPTAGVYSLSRIGDELWVGSDAGVYIRDAQGSWQVPSWSPMFAAGNLVWAVVDAGDGEFWLGGEKGLWRTRQDSAPAPVLNGSSPLISGRNVPALWRGANGGLWVPIHGRGLAYLRDDWKRTAVFKPDYDLSDGVYCGLAPAARSGGLWQLDGSGRLLRFDTTTGQATQTPWSNDELKGMQLTSALEDRHGRLWLGNLDSGLARIDLGNGDFKSWRPGSADAAPDYGAPDWLVEARDGSVWLSTLGVLQHRDAETGKVLETVSVGSGHGMDWGDPEQVGNGPDGRLWVAGGGGVIAWDDRAHRFEPIAELAGERVYSFAYPHADHLWLHRMTGLEQWRRAGGAWRRERVVGQEQGLPALESLGMQLDAAGRVWLSSRRGLWRLDVSGREAQVRNFGLRDGLTSQEFVDGCLLTAKDGVLVGGTTDGYVVLLDTAMPDASAFTPEMMMETASVLRDGKRVDLPVSAPFRLDADDRQLQVNTRLLSFGDPLSNRYRSWLQGFDSGWVEQGTASMREFSSLPAGEYTLSMQGIDPMGNVSKVRTLHFSVAPPWWRSQWGIAASVALLALLVAIAAALYRRRVRARSEWQLAQHKQEIAEQASLAKTRFLATLGHEVRTPMTGVLGMSELLLQTPLDERQHGYASSIQSAGKHLLRLVNDALDLARIEAGKLPLEMRNFDLREALDQVCTLVRPMAESKGLRFEYRSDADLPRALHGDTNRVQQILLNLLVNAIKFTERGSVSLHAGRGPGATLGSGICFEIADTGPGISDEQRERLFRRFEQAEGARTAARYGGSGLGLAICRELAVAMGGRIDVESTLGHGTRFLVELPLRWAAEAAAFVPRQAQGRAPARSLRLLLVEDEPTVAEVIMGLLRARGHQVTHAAHGLAALAEASAVTFDAGLCDLDLPGLDGLALVRQLRGLGHAFPIIAITARSDAEAEPQALDAGCDGFLRKPLTGDILQDALSEVLAGADASPRQQRRAAHGRE
ncbi:MAG TPA: hybrid sensor histidine kinase/response regulator [Xanthomonadaceae bacterium]|nr:hybrid sensor histidine kinase/response regulator [Xanthomonadaceae bacterium]